MARLDVYNDTSLLKITHVKMWTARGQVILFIVNLMKEKFTSQLRPATGSRFIIKYFSLIMRGPSGQETDSRVMSHFVKATCGKRTMIWLDIDNMEFISHLSIVGENQGS